MNGALDWAGAYLGKPWVSGARGPDAFDCWGLVCAVYQDRLGIALDSLPGICATDPAQYLPAFREASGRWLGSRWLVLPEPADFCVVGMSTARELQHVGLWIGAAHAVLHCRRGSGVIAQTRAALRADRMNVIGFYGFNSANQ